MARLSNVDMDAIPLSAKGRTQRDIAEIIGTNHSVINRLLTNWRRIRLGRRYAAAHRARIVNTFLEEHSINRSVWPANNWDVNPIENEWALLKRRIRDRKPVLKMLDELEIATREEWLQISPEQIAAILLSMARRCMAMFRGRAGTIKYSTMAFQTPLFRATKSIGRLEKMLRLLLIFFNRLTKGTSWS